MSKRNKLEKFAELLSFPNVFENFDHKDPKLTVGLSQTVDLKNKWGEFYFKNNHPIVLELACGRGEYTIALAERYPDKNFIGVDIKGARIWKGAKYALENELKNVAFLRTRIEQIEYFFAQDEIDEIWITFPDPFINKENRRLSCIRFLNRYHKFLKTGGIVHLKTDAYSLYEFTLEELTKTSEWELIYDNSDIYSSELYTPDLEIKTYYEKDHLSKGKKITYTRFKKV